jgi:4-hydroxybenzoate polyprenyltransferase
VSGTISPSLTLAVFATAMSSWMGFVGSMAKDLSDVPGDAQAGRRTFAVVKGARRAARRLSLNAVGLGTGFLAAAVAMDHVLIPPAAVMLLGAVGITLAARPVPTTAQPRRPYRIFMLTQYLAHAAVIPAIVCS